jgi:hypothetical protein
MKELFTQMKSCYDQWAWSTSVVQLLFQKLQNLGLCPEDYPRHLRTEVDSVMDIDAPEEEDIISHGVLQTIERIIKGYQEESEIHIEQILPGGKLEEIQKFKPRIEESISLWVKTIFSLISL